MKRREVALLLTLALSGVSPNQFIDSLSPSLKQKALIRFDDRERFNWHYTPRQRRGVAIADLSPKQRDLLHDFLRSGLSQSGYRKVSGIIELEPILGRIEGSSFRDPGRYYFSLFGDPARAPWGWRFEGHHLSINTTHASRDTLTPMFLGANPARVPDGPRVLADEEILGRALFASLDATQRAIALIATRAPWDIVTGTDRTFHLEKFEGLPAAKMSAAQRESLMRLISVYVGNANAAVAAAEMRRIQTAGVERLHFAWAGGDRPGQPHYYRVHGPMILIEYDNTQNGANHIHTVWRSPDGDFGGDDLLARHYSESPHHISWRFPR